LLSAFTIKLQNDPAFSQEEVVKGCKWSLNYFQSCEVVESIATYPRDCKINLIPLVLAPYLASLTKQSNSQEFVTGSIFDWF